MFLLITVLLHSVCDLVCEDQPYGKSVSKKLYLNRSHRIVCICFISFKSVHVVTMGYLKCVD